MVDLYISGGTLNEEQTSEVELSVLRLREIVARVLSHEETGVFPAAEVTVETHYMDTIAPGRMTEEHSDFMECDVQVIVNSNHYAWREERKDELAQEIMDAYGDLLPPNVTAWVWLRLHHAGFAKRKAPAA